MLFKKNKEEKTKETTAEKSAEKETKSKKDSKLKKIFKNKKKLTIFIIAGVLLLGIIGYPVYSYFFSTPENAITYTDAPVTRGSVVNVIEGSGTIEAKAQYEVKYLSSVDVLEDYFEEGDYVEKDQILYQMDSEDIQRNITRQKRSVEKARLNYEDALEAVSDLNVKSEIGGVITNLYVSKGDKVNSGAKIADVVDKDTLLLSIPFGADDAKNIYAGQSAEVTLLDSLTSMNGRVTDVGTGTYINSYGVEVTDVEIEVKNPGAVTEGTVATAVVGNYACYDSAALEYCNTKTITAKTSGDVVSISKKRGDSVSKNDTILTLESENSDRSVRDAQISYEDAKSSLDQLLESSSDATIRSKIAGKVIQKNIKAGEILDSNTSSTMAIIADLSSLKFDMSIDELDISKISVGQEVTVTADALSGRQFRGTVSNVSIVGSAYQGVTSYPVTITIDNAEQTALIPGMNVEAQIVIDSAENVLRVPVSALRMGNLVVVKDDGTFKDPLEMEIPQFGTQRPAGNDSDKKPETADEKETNKTDGNAAPTGKGAPAGYGAPTGKGAPTGYGAPTGKGAPTGVPGNSPTNAGVSDKDGTQGNAQGKAQPSQPTGGFGKMSEADLKDMQKKQKERLKSMIESIDVPEGYTVVRVQTGLNDGSYVEIKEIEGSLKEGDLVLVPMITNTQSQMSGGMPGGMGGGMSGGMRPTGGMGGGMSGGMRPTGGFGGGMRSSGGSFGGNRQGGFR